uniref:Uncharacterized protein n=1 Tax=Triticum urartu TaxID=4572 RepID=A0A8R7P0A2_TRIUA
MYEKESMRDNKIFPILEGKIFMARYSQVKIRASYIPHKQMQLSFHPLRVFNERC